MKTRLSNLSFRLMTLEFKLRDRLHPRREVLEEVGIRPGSRVLDYGCGPGSYVEPAARMVGESGEVYALDCHPLAIRAVQRLAARRGLTQVRAILSDGPTGLPENSMDVVLLYDILHDLDRPDEILREIRRVLSKNGVLSVSDHHLGEADIVARVTAAGLLRLSNRKRHTISFSRTNGAS